MSIDIYLSVEGVCVYDCNITHNLAPMWRAAGVWNALYESHGQRAVAIRKMVDAGVAAMRADPAKFRKLDSPNGWGIYEHALPFLEGLAEALARFPLAVIEVSR